MQKILIIDDEEPIASLTQGRLQNHGYQATFALNGIEGFQKAQNEKPQLILLDIMMPGVDGYAVLKQLKTTPATRHIPVIMFTAKSQIQNVNEAIALGAIDYIVKPFNPEDLIEKVRLTIA